MSSDTDPELRASDFRKAWPTAMAVALRECGDLAEQIGQTNASIQESKLGIFKLAEMIPKFLTAAEARLDSAVKTFIDEIAEKNELAVEAIQADREELASLRKSFISDIRAENQKLLDTANRLQKETEMLEKAKSAFKEERLVFSKLSMIERLFYKS